MKWLYALLLLLSIVVPFALSFDKKLHFYKQWNRILPSITLVAGVYIIFDACFTHLGVWGFNPSYYSSRLIFGLPLEEWLFFFVIPYASLFIHYSFFLYFPNQHFNARFGKVLTLLLMLLFTVILIYQLEKMYTVYVLSFLLVGLLLSFFDRSRSIDKLYVSFLIILIPFLIVNGILTGSFIDSEVVWYNPAEIIGMRIFTIPIEDFAYGFSMILFNVLIIEWMNFKSITNNA